MPINVEDIQPGQNDYAGNRILCVFAYNPPDYAVYRTEARVMVHFADRKQQARQQRRDLSKLTSMRGEINGLIDGWHDPGHTARAGDEGPDSPHFSIGKLFGGGPSRSEELYKRAIRYDRRVADAVVTALEGDCKTALRLLAEVKNDIISERTSMARWSYLKLATFLVLAAIVAMTLLARWASPPLDFRAEVMPVWTAVSGGTVGAFFSIAIGLKGRTVLIDLQNRDNTADAILRILIGAVAGGVLMCLLVSGLLANSLINVELLKPDHPDYSELMIFIIGFLGGFSERLVPDFLAQTTLGTKEKTEDRAAQQGPTGGPDRRDGGPDGSGARNMDLGPADSPGAGGQAQDGSAADGSRTAATATDGAAEPDPDAGGTADDAESSEPGQDPSEGAASPDPNGDEGENGESEETTPRP
ncbi:MAG TPA: hypothetical protein VD887_01870 [Allosphingosinicella sp.]|nr:hypothetical protein [Allosphingosinicella sp.]